MPQMQLPVFPAGAEEINGVIGVQKDAGARSRAQHLIENLLRNVGQCRRAFEDFAAVDVRCQ